MEFYSTIKYLTRKRWIKVKKHFTKVCRYFGGVIESSRHFVKDGWVFSVECNTYKVMPNQKGRKIVRLFVLILNNESEYLTLKTKK